MASAPAAKRPLEDDTERDDEAIDSEEEDEDYVGGKDDDEDAGSGSGSSDNDSDEDDGARKKRRGKKQKAKKSKAGAGGDQKRRRGGLETIDADEIAALREEVIEAYGEKALREDVDHGGNESASAAAGRRKHIEDVFKQMQAEAAGSFKLKRSLLDQVVNRQADGGLILEQSIDGGGGSVHAVGDRRVGNRPGNSTSGAGAAASTAGKLLIPGTVAAAAQVNHSKQQRQQHPAAALLNKKVDDPATGVDAFLMAIQSGNGSSTAGLGNHQNGNGARRRASNSTSNGNGDGDGVLVPIGQPNSVCGGPGRIPGPGPHQRPVGAPVMIVEVGGGADGDGGRKGMASVASQQRQPQSPLGLDYIMQLAGKRSSSSSGRQTSAATNSSAGNGQSIGSTVTSAAVESARRSAILAAATSALQMAGNKKIAITRVVKFAGEARTVTEWVAPNSAAARQAMAANSQAAARAALAALNGGPASAAVAAAGADTAAADEAGASSASAGSSAGAASGAGAGGSGSASGTITLDALVSNLDKPEAISTLAKTNIDWEQYKVKEGLDEDFESKAARGGFVDRQQFLSRVDDRQADAERAKRAEERRVRELQSMAAANR